MIVAVAGAELEPVLVVDDALSTIFDGVDPLVKSEPHSDCKALAAVDAVLGKLAFRTLYACFTQSVQVMLEGMASELVKAFSIALMLLTLRVPSMLWMFVRVSVTQFVPESVKQIICLTVG